MNGALYRIMNLQGQDAAERSGIVAEMSHMQAKVNLQLGIVKKVRHFSMRIKRDLLRTSYEEEICLGWTSIRRLGYSENGCDALAVWVIWGDQFFLGRSL